jgi:capsular polysaccharide biosynthesis protein
MIVTEHPYLITNDGSNDIQNIPIWIFEWLKKKYIKSDLIQNTSLPKKIYIDRSDSSSNTRNLRLIINESEVKSFLIDNGFKSIALGNLHFKEQVELFNNAEFIIGLHGGGFSNLSFCKKNTKVLELKNTTDEKVIENLALNNDLIYKSIKSEAVKFKFAQFGHINVSINSLKKEIDNFG